MYKQFNWRNFYTSLILDLVVGATVGVFIVYILSPILGYVPSFTICGAVGVIVGFLINLPFPWYTYPEGE